MAEPSRSEIEAICRAFLPAFNAGRSEAYELMDSAPSEDADFAIRSSASGSVFRIQHVRAVENGYHDLEIPLRSSGFVSKVRRRLEAKGHSGLAVSLSSSGLPKNDDDLDTLAEELADFVDHKTKVNSRPLIFSLDAEDDLQRLGLGELLRRIPQIEIFRTDPPGVIVANAPRDVPITPHLDEQQIVERAIARKERHYGGTQGDIVLLVEWGAFPFWRRRLRELEASRSGKPTQFREVWLVSTVPVDQWARRLV